MERTTRQIENIASGLLWAIKDSELTLSFAARVGVHLVKLRQSEESVQAGMPCQFDWNLHHTFFQMLFRE